MQTRSLFLLLSIFTLQAGVGGNGAAQNVLEPGGDVSSGDVVVNSRGAMYWDGTTWATDATYGHAYPTDDQGRRLVEHDVRVIESDVTGLGEVSGLPAGCAVTRSLVSHVTSHWRATELVCRRSLRYDVELPGAGGRIVLFSREPEAGSDGAYLEAYFPSPDGNLISSIRKGPVVAIGEVPLSEPWLPQAASFTYLFGAMIPDTTYWMDVEGGADLGGHTLSFKTGPSSKPPPYGYLSTSVTEIRVMFPGEGGRVEELVFLPALAEEIRLQNSQSQLIVKSLKLRKDESNPERNTLTVSGSSMGSLYHPTILRVGEHEFDISGVEYTRRKYVYSDETLDVRLKYPQWGTRWTYKLKITGSELSDLDPDGEVELAIEANDFAALCRVTLNRGEFKLGKQPRTLAHPRVFLHSLKLGVRPGGGDSYSLKLGLSTDGAIPATAPDLVLLLGQYYHAIIASSSFEKVGDTFRYRGTKGGVTSVVLDYARETLIIKGKGVELGLSPGLDSGGRREDEPMVIGLRLGALEFSCEPRLRLKGRKLTL